MTNYHDEQRRPRRLRWRLRVMMAERGIRTVTELTRRLGDIGIEISTQQMNRIANELPARLPTDVLAGLVTVLRCEVGDLIVAEPAPTDRPPDELTESHGLDAPSPASPPKRRGRSRRPVGGDADGRAGEDDLAALIGPPAVLFDVPGAGRSR